MVAVDGRRYVQLSGQFPDKNKSNNNSAPDKTRAALALVPPPLCVSTAAVICRMGLTVVVGDTNDDRQTRRDRAKQ